MYQPQEIGPWQDAWLRSLESGIHSQTTQVLTRKTKRGWAHCCLGIACETSITNGITLDIETYGGITAYNTLENVLPNSEVERYKFYDEEGFINTDFIDGLDPDTEDKILGEMEKFGYDSCECNSLARMNDKGKKFSTIAKFVRRFPQSVFSEPA